MWPHNFHRDWSWTNFHSLSLPKNHVSRLTDHAQHDLYNMTRHFNFESNQPIVAPLPTLPLSPPPLDRIGFFGCKLLLYGKNACNIWLQYLKVRKTIFIRFWKNHSLACKWLIYHDSFDLYSLSLLQISKTAIWWWWPWQHRKRTTTDVSSTESLSKQTAESLTTVPGAAVSAGAPVWHSGLWNCQFPGTTGIWKGSGHAGSQTEYES